MHYGSEHSIFLFIFFLLHSDFWSLRWSVLACMCSGIFQPIQMNHRTTGNTVNIQDMNTNSFILRLRSSYTNYININVVVCCRVLALTISFSLSSFYVLRYSLNILHYMFATHRMEYSLPYDVYNSVYTRNQNYEYFYVCCSSL